MNGKRWLTVAVVVLMVAGSMGCRGRRQAAGGYPPGHLDADWAGSDEFGIGGMLSDRFDYSQVLDIQFENVLFGFDSSQIAAGEQSKIEAVTDYMRRNPDVKLILEGHTCDVGAREYNMALGERRALAARAYLVQSGIDPVRMQTRSFGMEKPMHIGASESIRRLNRRAEFVLVR